MSTNTLTVVFSEKWSGKSHTIYRTIEIKKETNMITKDNIEAVLKHNGIDDFNLCTRLMSMGENNSYIEIYLDNPNLIPIIKAHYGMKLEPLPENEIVLKVGDVVEFGEFDALSKFGKLNIVRFDYQEDFVVYNFGGSVIRQAFEYFNTNKSVNGRQGKYIIPPFDFKQTLIDAGWLIDDGNNDILGNGAIWVNLRLRNFWDDARQIEFNPANAARLIELAELAEELEHE